MSILKLQKSGRLFFTSQNISEILGISDESARVFCTRYVKKGILVRLKKNVYILKEKIGELSAEELFKLSNLIQTPSYVSFMTALSYYGVTTQISRGVVEAVSLNRSSEFDAEDLLFVYSRFKKALYFGFTKNGDFFIAIKEKALLDALYMSSFGKYNLDVSSIDFSQFSKKILFKFAKKFPKRTQKLLNELL